MTSESILTVDSAVIEYRRPDSTVVRAVNGVSFSLARGEILGVVGESGCGKSTLARGIMGLTPLASGSIAFHGQDVVPLGRRARPVAQRPIQMIFQDTAASLNPRRTIGAQIAEVLRARAGRRRDKNANQRSEVVDILERVGLPETAAERYPHEFSGGQRQRIALARALASEPEVIVADEPISALDASAQAYAANLLVRVCREQGIALVFISHDLAVVRAIADRVVVMYLGTVTEEGPTRAVWQDPRHPYARALIEAIPVPDGSGRRPVGLSGDVPNPADVPTGCSFHPRCPERVAACSSVTPRLTDVGEKHRAACLLVEPALVPSHG